MKGRAGPAWILVLVCALFAVPKAWAAAKAPINPQEKKALDRTIKEVRAARQRTENQRFNRSQPDKNDLRSQIQKQVLTLRAPPTERPAPVPAATVAARGDTAGWSTLALYGALIVGLILGALLLYRHLKKMTGNI